MKSRTLPGEKYAKALQWCDTHHSMLPRLSKWRLMHKETLYAFLESVNVRWSSARKIWYKVSSQDDPMTTRRNDRPPMNYYAKTVSVRITASTIVMNDVLAEFTELCEALDWQVKVSPKRYPNGNDGFERAYVEVIRTRS